jgi:hypothetical protein
MVAGAASAGHGILITMRKKQDEYYIPVLELAFLWRERV